MICLKTIPCQTKSRWDCCLTIVSSKPCIYMYIFLHRSPCFLDCHVVRVNGFKYLKCTALSSAVWAPGSKLVLYLRAHSRQLWRKRNYFNSLVHHSDNAGNKYYSNLHVILWTLIHKMLKKGKEQVAAAQLTLGCYSKQAQNRLPPILFLHNKI